MKRVIVDVREIDEFKSGHYQGAINIPLSKFSNKDFITRELSEFDQVIVYCRSGGRATMAEQLLRSYGISNVKNGINQTYLEDNIDSI